MAFAALKKGAVGVNSRTGDVLDRGLNRLDALINQLVLTAHLQAGAKPELKRTVLQELLREVRDTTVLERDIDICVAVDCDMLEVDVDERLIFSALSNLTQNAVKFTKSDGHVTVRARAEETHILIEVEDECGGLPSGDVNELFRPFEQRGADRTGLGLGLAFSHWGVEQNNGRIYARNLAEKGCVFTVDLPRISVAAPAAV